MGFRDGCDLDLAAGEVGPNLVRPVRARCPLTPHRARDEIELEVIDGDLAREDHLAEIRSDHRYRPALVVIGLVEDVQVSAVLLHDVHRPWRSPGVEVGIKVVMGVRPRMMLAAYPPR